MKKHAVAVAVLLAAATQGAWSAEGTPWWKEHKIRFMWGQWMHVRVRADDDWAVEAPREHFRNIAQAGGTVYVEFRGGYSPPNARFAREFGMRYFAHTEVIKIPEGRRAIAATGEPTDPRKGTCPLDDAAYERWLIEPYIAGIREGLIDGIDIDWETYAGRGEPDNCYCDDCVSQFLKRRDIEAELPEKAARVSWLEERGLIGAWEDTFAQRRIEMFSNIRRKLHAVNPDLLFSSYGLGYGRALDFARAMNTPEAPFIYVSSQHYTDHDQQPWWESYGERWRKEGFLYIAGGWTQALFGAQVSQVSAARWIYEAAVNEDGCWLWFERELDDEILRAYAAADREIKTVERAVGELLLRGERDPSFVTAVEWTGRPELARAFVHRTYHLGPDHMAHISNVNTEWPVRVRVRFPRLVEDRFWTVRDPISEHYYTRDGRSPRWTTAELQSGVVVAMEPRSDIFLLVSPADEGLAVEPPRLVHSREFDTLPDHSRAAARAGAVTHFKDDSRAVIHDVELERLLSSAVELTRLPRDGWRLKMDQDDVGVGEQWFLPAAPLDGWTPVGIETFWGDKGGTGAGWYRADVDIPKLPAEGRIYLHFGAVDEELKLWIDGEYVDEYDRGPEGWDKPFAVDVTGKLRAGRRHFALRVHNSAFAGGVWRPVRVLARPAVRVGPSGRLTYTATEPMGYLGAEGKSSIGNAILSADADGRNQVRVRQVHGHLWSPRYSPDGSRIAFVHDAGGRGQIFVMNEDGAGAVNVSNNDFCDRAPVWSPDGQTIAFVSDREGDWDIWVMDADGGGQRRLAGNPGLDRAPAWSPNGRQIAWESHASGIPTIWVCDAEARNSRPAIAPDRPPKMEHVSGPGQRGETTRPTYADNTFYLRDPVWSPDGGRIAALAMGGGVVVVKADGSHLLSLRGFPYASDLCWSPDGTRLATAWRNAPYCTDRSGITVMSADGAGEGGTNPKGRFMLGRDIVDVSPDGPRLRQVTYIGSVHTWYSHGSAQPRTVLKTLTSLTWSPDSKTLAFSSDMHPSGAFHVYTIPVGGGEPKRLDATMSAWPNEIMWRPR